MPNLNKVQLMGHLTRDPETRQTQGGHSVTSFGLAINRHYKVGEEKREEVTFVDVDFWGKGGEVIAQYAQKGDPIYIDGRLTFRQWQADDGSKRSKLSITGEGFQFLRGKDRDTAKDGGKIPASGGKSGFPTNEQATSGKGQFDEVPY